MDHKISRYTAQQIVEAIKNISDYNVNYIDGNGIIFASTDPSRIGTFHEIGKHAFMSGETIEVNDNNEFIGTHSGVNIPILYGEEIVAVIGITGNPNDVGKYAYLAQKITYLLLREQDLDLEKNTLKTRISYVVSSLISGGARAKEKLVLDYLEEKKIKNGLFRTLIIRTPKTGAGASVYQMETEIYGAFKLAKGDLYSFRFPNEYRLIIEDKRYNSRRSIFLNLLSDKDMKLCAGVGMPHSIHEQDRSYREARTALQCTLFPSGAAEVDNTNESQADSIPNLVEFDKLGIETLLVNTDTYNRELFLNHSISKLNDHDLKVLSAYFDEDMSLANTAKKLFVHKNTLQYQLDKIYTKSGLNPRSFKDACCLYTAIKLIALS